MQVTYFLKKIASTWPESSSGLCQTTKEMKILLKRGLWSHKTGHISNTIYDRKLKFGTQVKDFTTYMTTIQSSF
jgi:hypothetical protein